MKNLFFLISLVAVLMSCKDVVKDHQPVSSDSWRTDLVKKIQSAENDAERNTLMEKNGQVLTTQLISFLRTNGYNCNIDTIMYRYGSGKAKDVASGDKKTYSGHFDPQPYAIVKGGSCFKDSLYVFILCFNGTFQLKSNSSSIGNGNLIFTIKKGEGINRYVDYKTSIWLADQFDLPLYKGKKMIRTKKITPETALSLARLIDSVQVTVKVFPGDRFDLGKMTLNGVRVK
jgi:hypothetical protein